MAVAYWTVQSSTLKYNLDDIYQCAFSFISRNFVKVTFTDGVVHVFLIIAFNGSHNRSPKSGYNGAGFAFLQVNHFTTEASTRLKVTGNPTAIIPNVTVSDLSLYTVTSIENCERIMNLVYNGVSKVELVSITNFIPLLMELYTSFHSDPVYVEATKLKYTDGTYNFARGNNTSDQARKKAYDYLLKTYGTFYRGTEEELASSFATELSAINGGG